MSEQPLNLPGPVFEAGPGWGARLQEWFKINFGRRILPFLAVIIFLTGLAMFFSRPRQSPTLNQTEQLTDRLVAAAARISVTIQPGDGIITASRRALEQYWQKFPEPKNRLSPVQRLQIDNFFKERFANQSLVVGEEISFSEGDLQQAVEEAQRLTLYQIKQLEKYLPQ